MTSYGAIARALGTAASSRMVGYALRASQGVYPPIPAHRVVNRIGLLTGKAAFGSPTMMEQLLENEGVTIQDDRIVDFKKLFWEPEKNNIQRCIWCGEDPLYVEYHDNEWGKPVKDDRVLFEFLVLESAQAGLSWITILRKREGYRKNFADFYPEKVAKFTETDVERILQDPGIIRNRNKVVSTIKNAQAFLAIQKEFGSFYNYLFSFMPDKKIIVNKLASYKDAPTSSKESILIAKDLKKRGVKFFGPTICYAYMQAVGMVNDHEDACSFKFK